MYEASTMLLVSPGKNTQTNEYNTLIAGEKLALTYNEMLQGETILKLAISQLGLQITPEQLADMIKVETIPSTQLIRLTVASTSPTQADVAGRYHRRNVYHPHSEAANRAICIIAVKSAEDNRCSNDRQQRDPGTNQRPERQQDCRRSQVGSFGKAGELQRSELQSLEQRIPGFSV